MLKIEIHSNELNSFTWKDKSGTERTGYKQSAYVHLPDKPFPVEIQLRVDGPSKAFSPGVYELSPKSFWVDRFGSLSVTPSLVATAEKVKAVS